MALKQFLDLASNQTHKARHGDEKKGTELFSEKINLPPFSVLLMAVATYFTRMLGYLVLRNRTLSPNLQSVMEAAPDCVLIAVIAPKFASGQPADMAALAITLLAATRFSILPVVLIAIAALSIPSLIQPSWPCGLGVPVNL